LRHCVVCYAVVIWPPVALQLIRASKRPQSNDQATTMSLGDKLYHNASNICTAFILKILLDSYHQGG